jgi:hypothetical protein
MASNTVAKTPSPDFLSFAELMLDQFAARMAARILPPCDYSRCQDSGVIHLIESEEDLCLAHFNQRKKEL